MSLYEKIVNKEEKIAMTGLGYVGMPIAVAFSKKADVIGYDMNEYKIEQYKNGKDPTREVGDEAIAACSVDFTTDETRLREAKFHIVAVPTPVNPDHTPDLEPIRGPVADEREANLTYGVHFTDIEEIRDMDAVILAVAHEEYLNLEQKDLDMLYRSGITKVLIDVKSILNRKEYEDAGYVYWRL